MKYVYHTFLFLTITIFSGIKLQKPSYLHRKWIWVCNKNVLDWTQHRLLLVLGKSHVIQIRVTETYTDYLLFDLHWFFSLNIWPWDIEIYVMQGFWMYAHQKWKAYLDGFGHLVVVHVRCYGIQLFLKRKEIWNFLEQL